MKNTAAKFVSAIFATVVASNGLLAAPEAEEKEKPAEKADTCLLGPSASVPPGGHWYYRRDNVNKRNCWYLGDAKGKAARKQVAEEDAAPAGKPAAPPPKKPAAQRPVSDARAEFTLPQASTEPDTKAAATQEAPVSPFDAQRADEPRKVVTTRWPEPVAVSPPAPAAAPPPPVVQNQPQAQPQTQAQTQMQAVPAPPQPRPAAPPAPLAKATAAADQPLSMPMLLTVLAGGLSVIGVMGSAMFARGKSRRDKSRPRRHLSRSAPMPPLPTAEQPLPENPRAADDPNRRLQHMLAEIQKRAAA